MSRTIYYQRNREVMLSRANKYYENSKEVLREKARSKYRKLFEKEKNIKRKYERNRYHNLSEEKKQRLKEYRRNYCDAKKLEQTMKRRVLLKTSSIDIKNQ